MTVNPKYKHSEATDRIIGCAMQVHNTLGKGFQEVILEHLYRTPFRLELLQKRLKEHRKKNS